jgi:hypothetical protein
MVVIAASQAGNGFLGSLKGLQIRAQDGETNTVKLVDTETNISSQINRNQPKEQTTWWTT